MLNELHLKCCLANFYDDQNILINQPYVNANNKAKQHAHEKHKSLKRIRIYERIRRDRFFKHLPISDILLSNIDPNEW